MLGPLNKTLSPLGKSKSSLFAITSFVQSIGSDLLVNGDFSGWTGTAPNRNPNSWSVSGEGTGDEITEVGSTEGHGGSGTGACNFFADSANVPVITQANALTPAGAFEITADVSRIVTGQIRFQSGANVVGSATAQGVKKFLVGRSSVSSVSFFGGATPPTDATLNSVAAKFITTNVRATAYADLVADVYFPIPSSPVAGDRIELLFRIPTSTTQELVNGWSLNFIRDDTNVSWGIAIDRFASGVRNNHTTSSGITGIDGIRIRASGNTIRAFILSNGVETQRGSTVTASNFNTDIGVNVVYTAAFAPTLLTFMAAA